MPLPQRVSSTTIPVRFWTIIFATLLLSCCNNLQADIVQYTFTGEIPVGATDTHSEIDIGETWVAILFVDTSISDENAADPNHGVYLEAVINGSLTFSGGYTSPFDFASFDTYVFDDVSLFEAFIVDTILVTDQDNDNVFSATTTDLSSLMSDSLPGPGTTISPFPPITDVVAVFQLTYSDTNGSVSYNSSDANNVAFSASAVPEPSSFLAILLVTLSATLRRRK